MNRLSNYLTSRRDFLKASVLAGGALAAPSVLSGAAAPDTASTPSTSTPALAPTTGPSPVVNHETLRVGLIGCGGRGTGAASEALSADPNVVLTAMGDAFEDQLQKSLQGLQSRHPDKVKVTSGNCFVGLDAYQKVINSDVDVVLLATPPGFRPTHLKAAVAARKHVFCEKPMATDAPGVRSVLQSAKLALESNLSLVAGFCSRYHAARREFYRRIHDGAIGDVRAIYATYYTGQVKPMPPASKRPADMGDLEWQLRNWYNFVWLSGDGYVEQACHNVDKAAWALKDQHPLKAVAVGGRQTPNQQGNIFDHMFVVYEFEDQVRVFLGQRQIGGTHSENSDRLMGTSGYAEIPGGREPFIKGKENWRYRGPKPDMYQTEHDELFASIRQAKPINDGEWMAHSTLMAIMGRMAAYTGQEVNWEQALNSEEKLVPDALDWKMRLDIAPMAMPGTTKLA